MGIGETIIIYLVIGVGVSIAVVLRADNQSFTRRAYLASVGLIFWPVFVPTLIARRESSIESSREIEPEPSGALIRISKIEDELNALLVNKDGWAERVLAGEADRICSLIVAMRSQAQRVSEMALLLSGLNARSQPLPIAGEENADRENDAAHKHTSGFLHQLHDNAERELWRAIAKTEELINMIYVARFAGGSRSEMDNLLIAISSTVESISAVAGQQTH